MLENSRAKLEKKNVDMICANNLKVAGAGFGVDTNIITLITTFAFIWLGLLLFLGTMVTHDYSMGKNVIICLSTIVGMVFIMFLAVLFTTLVSKIVGLITNIVDEIQYRL